MNKRMWAYVKPLAHMSSDIHIHPCVPGDPIAIQALRAFPSSILGDVMGRLIGTVGLHPVNRSTISVCGSALTVRVRAGDNLLIHKALDMLRPGDVLVVDGEGDVTRALVGEIMMTTAIHRGALGFVIDGAVRDVAAFEQQQFPCWARGVNSRGPYKEGPGTINMPVTVGGMVVHPGDIIVGDADGLVAVAPLASARTAALAKEKLANEQATIAAIRAGKYDSSWVDTLIHQKGD
jgi:regulator of RNase E activity RraA